jgi:GNAT superfamily N-acetyltransferase
MPRLLNRFFNRQPKEPDSSEPMRTPPEALAALGGAAVSEVLTEQDLRALPELPDGYHYDPTSEGGDDQEIADLMNATGTMENITAESLRRVNALASQTRVHKRGIGVRTADDTLVGYGALFYKGDKGTLVDFAVNPQHQHRGIGKAILDARLGVAEEHGLTSLETELAPTNTLRTYYLEHGFRDARAGELVRGSDPANLDQLVRSSLRASNASTQAS